MDKKTVRLTIAVLMALTVTVAATFFVLHRRYSELRTKWTASLQKLEVAFADGVGAHHEATVALANARYTPTFSKQAGAQTAELERTMESLQELLEATIVTYGAYVHVPQNDLPSFLPPIPPQQSATGYTPSKRELGALELAVVQLTDTNSSLQQQTEQLSNRLLDFQQSVARKDYSESTRKLAKTAEQAKEVLRAPHHDLSEAERQTITMSIARADKLLRRPIPGTASATITARAELEREREILESAISKLVQPSDRDKATPTPARSVSPAPTPTPGAP